MTELFAFHKIVETIRLSDGRIMLFLMITIVLPQIYQVVLGEPVYQKFPEFYAPRIWLDGAIR